MSHATSRAKGRAEMRAAIVLHLKAWLDARGIPKADQAMLLRNIIDLEVGRGLTKEDEAPYAPQA